MVGEKIERKASLLSPFKSPSVDVCWNISVICHYSSFACRIAMPPCTEIEKLICINIVNSFENLESLNHISHATAILKRSHLQGFKFLLI